MGGEAILGLITSLLKKPLSITFDNHCSSQSLVEELSRQGVCCKGTIRANIIIGECTVMDAKGIGRAQHTFYRTYYADGLVTAMYNAQCWQCRIQQLWDQTPANIDQMVSKRVRSSQTSDIIEFNQCMGGVIACTCVWQNASAGSDQRSSGPLLYFVDLCVQHTPHMYRALLQVKGESQIVADYIPGFYDMAHKASAVTTM